MSSHLARALRQGPHMPASWDCLRRWLVPSLPEQSLVQEVERRKNSKQSELREKWAEILFGGYILCDSRKFTEASSEMQMPWPLLLLWRTADGSRPRHLLGTINMISAELPKKETLAVSVHGGRLKTRHPGCVTYLPQGYFTLWTAHDGTRGSQLDVSDTQAIRHCTAPSKMPFT